MAFSTFDELKDAIVEFTSELNPSDPISTFISLAEDEFFPVIKHYLGETTIVRVSANSAVELPDDFSDARILRVDGKLAVQVSGYGAVLAHGQIGYFQSGKSYVLVPHSDTPRSVELTYYAKPQRLSVTNQTNWVIEQFPAVYLYAALMQGFYWRGSDEAEAKASAKFDAAMGKVQADHYRAVNSGNQLVNNVGGFPYGD
ncbi:hypothetical protein JZX86_27705 [Agrobacterium rosae]|uniref:phage adaptor protein n=1 Tax=Agrobacterium rosae TaxID=1972867 RepID=UPI0019D40489|nr:hypothetical protein [Agrobacterium rosae]MBN7809109.1 hypothetical protein [Agrobacterium rosae]